MIYFVVEGPGRSAMCLLLAGWGKSLASRITIVEYRTLFRKRRLPLGSYIFAELDMLSFDELEKVALCWDALHNSGAPLRLLNHPLRVMRRYELLRTLHDAGINDFDVYRLTEARRPRFPVFLRPANDHSGPRSALLADERALDDAVEELIARGKCREDWIIEEFCDTRDQQGYYRKYGAFCVGGKIIPRHLQSSTEWVVKRNSRDVRADTAALEREYLETNPHEAQLKKIFALANIDYGRMDYTLQDGRIRVFEINTNPAILTIGPSPDPLRAGVKERFAEQLLPALAALDSCSSRDTVPIRFDPRPFYKRRRPVVELVLAVTGGLGLKRYEPEIYRRLMAVREWWNAGARAR